MKNYPNHFQLYPYGESVSHSEVISVCELSDDIWLKLPDGLAKYLELVKLNNLEFDTNGREVNITDKVTRETNRTWLQISSSVFDFSAGFHMYQLIFNDTSNDTSIDLYFCYHIQDNAPEKPYIYMERE